MNPDTPSFVHLPNCPNLRAASTGNVTALLLTRSESLDRLDRDGDRLHTERLEEVLGLVVDLEGRVGRDSEGRDFGDVSGSVSRSAR